jgi:hypothetical protein
MTEVVAKPKSDVGQRKLDIPLKMKVLAMMARGERYGTIRRILKDEHKIDYTDPALAALRKNNAEVLKEMELMILGSQAAESEQIHTKAMRQLNRRLDRASTDELEIDRLDTEYREGKMNLADYRKKKAGLIKMSVKDLLEISREMHTQIGRRKVGQGSGALPSGISNEGASPDPKWVEALMTAVQRGDTIAMQQLVINPGA